MTAPTAADTGTLLVDVRPPWPYRPPPLLGRDGLFRRRGAAVDRLVHVAGAPVVVRVSTVSPRRVVLVARGGDAAARGEAVARVRFALGVDDDVAAFHARFRADPLLGPVLRANPALRVLRRPRPWEALLLAVTEQEIAYEEAAAIQRRLVLRLGRRCPRTGLRDAPDAAAVAAAAPAVLQACGLSARRALTLWRAARAVAGGRVDLDDLEPERCWRGLRRVPGIGPWTVDVLAVHGHGRFDRLPAGDLGLLKLVGRLQTGDPRVRADEGAVRAFFARYAPWPGLAAALMLISGPPAPDRAPRPAGTRWSARAPRAAGA